MDNIKYQDGMSMEELVLQINSRLGGISTMHDINNRNILIIDSNFRQVFKQLTKLRAKQNELYVEMDGSFEQVIDAFVNMQATFEDLKKDVQGDIQEKE